MYIEKNKAEKIRIGSIIIDGFIIPFYLTLIFLAAFFAVLARIADAKWVANVILVLPYIILTSLTTLPGFPLLYIEFYFAVGLICVITGLLLRIFITKKIGWLIVTDIAIYILIGIIVLTANPAIEIIK